MKRNLPHRSLIIKERLDNITHEILRAAKDKIAMVILFGSYARGTWVQDVYKEKHIIYSYQSDLDILIVLSKNKYRTVSHRITHDIKQRLKKKGLISQEILETPATIEGVRKFIREPRITLIAESIIEVNRQLAKGQYFYSDIKKEGVLLYDSLEFQLTEAKELSWDERKKVAEKDYAHWYKRGSEFLVGAGSYFEKESHSLAAFSLHQAAESFYNTILLVFSGHKPKLHDIEMLSAIASIYNAELISIFPLALPEQSKAFELLRDAYIDARYNDEYNITKEELFYLTERIEKLQQITTKICLEHLLT